MKKDKWNELKQRIHMMVVGGREIESLNQKTELADNILKMMDELEQEQLSEVIGMVSIKIDGIDEGDIITVMTQCANKWKRETVHVKVHEVLDSQVFLLKDNQFRIVRVRGEILND